MNELSELNFIGLVNWNAKSGTDVCTYLNSCQQCPEFVSKTCEFKSNRMNYDDWINTRAKRARHIDVKIRERNEMIEKFRLLEEL
jgi:hypothetical protein